MVRFKNRWLLVEFISCAPDDTTPSHNPRPQLQKLKTQANLDSRQIFAALKQSVIANFGDTGWGAVGTSLTVKYYSPTTGICIIRVARDHCQLAWGATTLLTSMGGQRFIPNVVHVSGTIKHAQLSAIEHNREVVARFRARSNTPANYRDSYDDYLTQSTKAINALQD